MRISNYRIEGKRNIARDSTQTVIGPPKMPKDVSEKIAKSFGEAANEPEYRKFVIEKNAIPFYLPPDRAGQYLGEQREVCRSVMEKACILKGN